MGWPPLIPDDLRSAVHAVPPLRVLARPSSVRSGLLSRRIARDSQSNLLPARPEYCIWGLSGCSVQKRLPAHCVTNAHLVTIPCERGGIMRRLLTVLLTVAFAGSLGLV